MGCDIHLVLEKKFKDKWVGMREVNHFQHIGWDDKTKTFTKPEYIWCRARQRNYELFAKLAGVRGDGPDPKGIPDDASELSRVLFEEWGCDGHSHSWCTLEEYIQALLASEADPASVFLLSDKDPRLTHPYILYFGMDAPEDGEEYRVVFCFDN